MVSSSLTVDNSFFPQTIHFVLDHYFDIVLVVERICIVSTANAPLSSMILTVETSQNAQYRMIHVDFDNNI